MSLWIILCHVDVEQLLKFKAQSEKRKVTMQNAKQKTTAQIELT